MWKLTRRQREFLAKLVDLHNALSEPIHYSAIAEHVGVGKVAAYEMLRLLEEHGYVTSDYRRPEGARGPGRPEVVFQPTQEAVGILAQTEARVPGFAEWEAVRTRILERIRLAKTEGHEEALDKMVDLVADQSSPVESIAGMIAAIILGLQSLKESVGTKAIQKALGSIGLPGERGLSALGGIGIGLSMVDRWNQRVSRVFQEHMTRYQTMLSELNAENRGRLTQFTQDVIKIVSR